MPRDDRSVIAPSTRAVRDSRIRGNDGERRANRDRLGSPSYALPSAYKPNFQRSSPGFVFGERKRFSLSRCHTSVGPDLLRRVRETHQRNLLPRWWCVSRTLRLLQPRPRADNAGEHLLRSFAPSLSEWKGGSRTAQCCLTAVPLSRPLFRPISRLARFRRADMGTISGESQTPPVVPRCS